MNRALTIAEALDRVADSSDPNVNLGQFWATTFGVAVDSPEYFSALCAMHSTFTELRHEISEAELRDKAKQLYASAIARLMPFVSPAQVVHMNVSSVQQARDQINTLHLAADALPDRLLPDLQEPLVEDVIGQLQAIYGEAETLSDPETRKVVRESISTLTMVLRNYKTLGPDGAARIYGAVIGDLFHRYVRTPATKEQSRTLLQRTLGTARKVGYAVIFAGGVVHGADQLLTDGRDIAAIAMGEAPAPTADETASPPHVAANADEVKSTDTHIA